MSGKTAPGLPGLLLACAVAVAGIYLAERLLRDDIARSRDQARLDAIREVMPLSWNNDPLADRIRAALPGPAGRAHSAEIYRLRLDGEPVGLVFSPVRAEGYNGPIALTLGIGYDGTVTGVRVEQHRETPGLGDRVSQDNSDWIFGFEGKSLARPPKEDWAVEADGGAFDQLSGATISARGVTQAVARALAYHDANRSRLF